MKKRSLLTAVVMLIVSAIVLTSSTYAWFTAQNNANIAKTTASVTGEQLGNILVKTEHKDWSTSLAAEDLVPDGNKTLDPVDIDPMKKANGDAGSVSTIQSANFDTLNYVVDSTAGQGGMLVYSFDIKAVNATSGQNISLPVAWAPGGAFAYGVIAIDGTLATKTVSGNTETILWGPASGSNSYVALGSVTAATDDSSGTAGIIEAGEPTDGNSLGRTVTANASGETLTMSADAEHTVTVYIWAEGQDSDCVGSGALASTGFTFSEITLA